MKSCIYHTSTKCLLYFLEQFYSDVNWQLKSGENDICSILEEQTDGSTFQ